MLSIATHITTFLASVGPRLHEMDNESGFQQELGAWLRTRLPPPYLIQFERSTLALGIAKRLDKKEIDIVISSPDTSRRFAIELKFPRNGQYPEQMFAACGDIAFLEQLCEHGFYGGWFVMLVDHPLFYSGPTGTGVYSFFRRGCTLHGNVDKPTGRRKASVVIAGHYNLTWTRFEALRYLVVEVRGRTDSSSVNTITNE